MQLLNMTDTTEAVSSSLAELYFVCIESFAKLVVALSEPECDVIRRDDVRLSQILEEYGRIKIWGDQIKADLPARARGSLDDVLRDDRDLKSLVRGILQRLGMLLQQATHIARIKHDLRREMDQDSIGSVSDSDQSTDNDEFQRRRMPKIRLLFQQIAEQIRSLHEISSLLRRPTVTDKFIRSADLGLEAAKPQDLDSLDLNAAFGMYDSSHVSEKILQLKGLGKSLQSFDFSNEAVAPVSDALDHREIQDIRWLCQRLAKANTKRREQLQYWNTHPYDPNQVVTSTNSVANLDIALGKDSKIQVSTVKPLDPDVSYERPESILSKQSFSTVALSDVYDTRTNVRPRTIYTPTTIGRDHRVSIPGPPKMKDGETQFPCPYCGMKLEATDMTRQLWKRHVFRDLRPYVCTFEHCQNAGKLFSSRHEWKNHEFQIHRREYVCQRCQNRHASRKEMLMHLQEHYGDSIPLAQISIIVDICDRQVDPSHNHIESCIMCGEEVLMPAWHDHVATHMEDLSLFVLPAPEDDEKETGGSIISGGADVFNSSNDSAASAPSASSLKFSEAGGHDQIPAEFARIIANEEQEYTSKVSEWTGRQRAPSPSPESNDVYPDNEDFEHTTSILSTYGDSDHRKRVLQESIRQLRQRMSAALAGVDLKIIMEESRKIEGENREL
ncbi:hypothetical protein F4679DRAFT_551675 [Xylaria curta]|nr:hypothetical protein F4679DRAFT_551675 [Xylaria curta]